MLKTFKKSIALFVAIVFVMSLVPFGVMAEVENGETTTVVVPLSNVIQSRGGSSNRDKALALMDLSSGYKSFKLAGKGASGSSTYYAYGQYDLTGYEKILVDPNTKVTFSIYMGNPTTASRGAYEFEVYILPGAVDGYVNLETISFNNCANLGMHNVSGLTPITQRTDTTEAFGIYSDGISRDAVVNALNDGDNSIITVIFTSATAGADGSNFYANKEDTGLIIEYTENEVDDEGFLASIVESFSWDMVSNQSENTIVDDLVLPTSFMDAEITGWESSNSSVIDPQTGKVYATNKSEPVTLTATLSYNGYIATKTFELVVPKKIHDYSLELPGTLYDGVKNYPGNTGSSANHVPVVTKVPGVAGKEDMCYELRDANGNRRFDIDKTSGYTEFDRDILEFDVCVPSDCYGYYPQIFLYTGLPGDDYRTSANSEFYFKHDGLYNGRGGDLIFSWDGGKWHHVAIMAPGIVSSDASGIEYDRTIKIYVDGVLKKTIGLHESAYTAPTGIQAVRTNGLCPVSDYTEDNDWDTVACYIDNIRLTYGDIDTILAYNTKSSVVSATDDIDEIGGNLTVVTDGVTVKDIIDSIVIDEDATARVYDAQWNKLDESAVVADGYMLVVADTNATTEERAYSYYTIRVVDGKTAFDAAYITLDSATGAVAGNVKVYNYSGTDAEYQVYLAIYSDKELKTLIPAKLDAKTGKASFAAPAGTLADGETAKLLIWDINGVNPEIKSVSVTR